jgi:hypothetical protein
VHAEIGTENKGRLLLYSFFDQHRMMKIFGGELSLGAEPRCVDDGLGSYWT